MEITISVTGFRSVDFIPDLRTGHFYSQKFVSDEFFCSKPVIEVIFSLNSMWHTFLKIVCCDYPTGYGDMRNNGHDENYEDKADFETVISLPFQYYKSL